MSDDDQLTTAALSGERMTALLSEDQGSGYVRISHATGLPLVGSSETQTSQAFETWDPKVSAERKLFEAPGDEVLRREVRKLGHEIETARGHEVDVRTSHVLECQSEAPSEESELKHEEPMGLRAVPEPVKESSTHPDAIPLWVVALIVILAVCCGVALAVMRIGL